MIDMIVNGLLYVLLVAFLVLWWVTENGDDQ